MIPSLMARNVVLARNLVRIHEVIGTVCQSILIRLAMFCLVACVASQPRGPTGLQPANDRILLAGDIYVAEAHLRDFGFDPGPVDGVFTAHTRSAVRAYQACYGLPISGRLDLATRQELLPGLDERGLMR
jgi:hypothetical protein